MSFDVTDLPGMLEIDGEWFENSKCRQAGYVRGEVFDVPPIFFRKDLTAEQEVVGSYDYEAEFNDSDKMLCNQMRGVFGILNAKSDAVPSIRANTGTGTLMSLLGHDQMVFKDKLPWFKDHYSKEELSRVEVDDIRIRGDFELALGHMRRYKDVLGSSLPIFCPDTQGPFDLAHLLLGDAIFLEVYDDPPFVHHVMELCLAMGIKAHDWSKEVSGEPSDSMFHSCSLYTESAGIRICEDTTAIIGPDIMDEFAIPYSRKLAAHYGGAWIHYCGRNDHLTERICQFPEFTLINFGHIPGHEEDHKFEEDMRRCVETHTVYYGNWPRKPGESGRSFLDRMHEWASQGILIAWGDAALGEEGFGSVEEAMDYWRSK
ncbi:MAG: hypothetical protein JW808_06580 [Victivallales bacterium]|nr:hypothetical protein [Victivallales bacterium]